MSKDTFYIIIGVVGLVAWIQLWIRSKGYAYRKFILYMGICILVTVLSYIVSKAFDLKGLLGLTVLSFFGWIYFLIRGWLAEREIKRNKIRD